MAGSDVSRIACVLRRLHRDLKVSVGGSCGQAGCEQPGGGHGVAPALAGKMTCGVIYHLGVRTCFQPGTLSVDKNKEARARNLGSYHSLTGFLVLCRCRKGKVADWPVNEMRDKPTATCSVQSRFPILISFRPARRHSLYRVGICRLAQPGF